MERTWLLTNDGIVARQMLETLNDEFGMDTEIRQRYDGIVAIMVNNNNNGDTMIDPAMPGRFMVSWSQTQRNMRRPDSNNRSILGLAEAYGWSTVTR